MNSLSKKPKKESKQCSQETDFNFDENDSGFGQGSIHTPCGQQKEKPKFQNWLQKLQCKIVSKTTENKTESTPIMLKLAEF